MGFLVSSAFSWNFNGISEGFLKWIFMDEVFTRETALGLAMKFMNRSGRHSTDRGLSKPGKAW
jgi:hypothetical protein